MSAVNITTKSRNWSFTLNNYTEEELQTLLNNSLSNYVVIGKEVGSENGVPHLQGFMRFTNCVRLLTLTKINARCHWEPSRSGCEFNFKYCTKGKGTFNEETREWTNHGLDAEWVEAGTRPTFNQHIAGIIYNLETLSEIIMQHVTNDQHQSFAFELLEECADDLIHLNDIAHFYDDDDDEDQDMGYVTPDTTTLMSPPVLKRTKY